MNRLIPTLLCTTLVGTLSVPSAMAGWTLDPEHSQVAFVSIKSHDIGEAHHFEEISGQVDDEGQAQITIPLASVETLIPIRNERMREMLFKTAQYDTATLSAKIDPNLLAEMQPGEIVSVVAESTLSLHGQSQPLTLEMQAAQIDADTLMVASTKPVILDAANFGLGKGVEKLREIAGLERISKAVPVTFVLTFDTDQPATGATAAGDTAAPRATPETMAQYQAYRATIEAMTDEQKEAIAALFGEAR
jgi:polyisoprenoid-binding protein YceI